MFSIIGAIISGLVVGVLARFFYPGDVPLDWLPTIALGIGGSLLAGLVTTAGGKRYKRAGCLASIVGAVVLIFIGRQVGWLG